MTEVKISGTVISAFIKQKSPIEPILQYGPVDESLKWCQEKKKKLKQTVKSDKKTLNPKWNTTFDFALNQPVKAFKVVLYSDKENLGEAYLLPPVEGSIIGGVFPLTLEKNGYLEDKGEISVHVNWTGSSDASLHYRFKVFKEVFKYIEENEGFLTEGIFRISTTEDDVNQKLYTMIDSSGDIKISKLSHQEEIHSLAAAFKRYIRLAPPLISSDVKDIFLKYDANSPKKIIYDSVLNSFNQLPQTNRLLLVSLLGFLHEISKKSEKNKMDAKNLTIIFSPILTDISNMEDIVKFQFVLQTTIANFEEIFGVDSHKRALAEGIEIEEKENHQRRSLQNIDFRNINQPIKKVRIVREESFKFQPGIGLPFDKDELVRKAKSKSSSKIGKHLYVNRKGINNKNLASSSSPRETSSPVIPSLKSHRSSYVDELPNSAKLEDTDSEKSNIIQITEDEWLSTKGQMKTLQDQLNKMETQLKTMHQVIRLLRDRIVDLETQQPNSSNK